MTLIHFKISFILITGRRLPHQRGPTGGRHTRAAGVGGEEGGARRPIFA